jgi:hypothetical protein
MFLSFILFYCMTLAEMGIPENYEAFRLGIKSAVDILGS